MKAYEELEKQKSRDNKVSSSDVTSSVSSLINDVIKRHQPAASSQQQSDDSSSDERNEKSEVEKRRLWVEQYSPRSYLELLSEEFINRALLRWIKVPVRLYC